MIPNKTDLLMVLPGYFIKIISVTMHVGPLWSLKLNQEYSRPFGLNGLEFPTVSNIPYLHLKDERVNHPYYSSRFLWTFAP